MKFGMFTKEGDDKISSIVKRYKKTKQIIKQLYILSNKRGFCEASDTEVRDRVYEYLRSSKYRKCASCRNCARDKYFTKSGYLRSKYKKEHMKKLIKDSMPKWLL